MRSDGEEDIAVRLARIDDAEDLARLTLQLGYEVAASEVTARLSRILSKTDQQVLVAECQGRPIAWLHAAAGEFLESDTFVMIAGLVVDRNYRGRGVGRILMNTAEAWARTQGCSIVRLWSTSTRTRSHRFYERLGYVNVKTQYSFAKALDDAGPARLERLVPRVDQ
jgi:GNAT superfamily N-acetyltransferase